MATSSLMADSSVFDPRRNNLSTIDARLELPPDRDEKVLLRRVPVLEVSTCLVDELRVQVNLLSAAFFAVFSRSALMSEARPGRCKH